MISDNDIMECGRTAKAAKEQGEGKYKVEGFDLDGDDLSVICAWSGETVIITLY